MSIRTILVFMVLIVLLAASWSFFDLPDEAALKAGLSGLISSYGFWFVLVGSFIEALFLLGIYFPGSLIIFLAVGLAPSPQVAFMMIVAVSIGMFLGYLCDYALGRFGWYQLLIRFGLQAQLTKAKENVTKNDIKYVGYTYWNPGLASFTATASGITKMPLSRFLFLNAAGIVAWNTFWGILVYSLGASASNLISTKTVLLALSVLLFYEVARFVYKRRTIIQEPI